MGLALPAAFSIASLGLSAGKEIIGGFGAKAASDFEAQKAERAAALGRIKADQTDAAMREELSTHLANIDSIRSAAGVVPDSPTGKAIKAEETRVSDRERTNRLFNIRSQVADDEATASFKRRSGEMALGLSFLGGGAKLAGGIGRYYATG